MIGQTRGATGSGSGRLRGERHDSGYEESRCGSRSTPTPAYGWRRRRCARRRPGDLQRPGGAGGRGRGADHPRAPRPHRRRGADRRARRPPGAGLRPGVAAPACWAAPTIEFTAVAPGDEFTRRRIRHPGVRRRARRHPPGHPADRQPRLPDRRRRCTTPATRSSSPRTCRSTRCFAPMHAPWLKVCEVIDFVRAVAPRTRVSRLHDALLNADRPAVSPTPTWTGSAAPTTAGSSRAPGSS